MNFTVPQSFCTFPARERESESDDEVVQNIPADMVALWRRVKGSIRATAHMSRTEAFMKYAEENAGEDLDAIERETERVIARHVAQLAIAENDDYPADRTFYAYEVCEMFQVTKSRLVTLERHGVKPTGFAEGRRRYTREDVIRVRTALAV